MQLLAGFAAGVRRLGLPPEATGHHLRGKSDPVFRLPNRTEEILLTNATSFFRTGTMPPAMQAEVRQTFRAEFGHEASLVVAAPGRINLMGEHVDYNDGFVLPLAIDRYVVVAAACRNNRDAERAVRLHSIAVPETTSIALTGELCPAGGHWSDYVTGVIAGFQKNHRPIPDFDAVIGSTVPIGAGLSSSAALEVAFATLFERLTGHHLGLTEKALLCQEAEHAFAGVPCGIMDQFSSTFAIPDQLMLIDCKTHEVFPVPLDTAEVSVLIINSNVAHALNQGEYAVRRIESEHALQKTGKPSWRDVSPTDLEEARSAMSHVEFQRARHIVTEISRTQETARAISESSWPAVGDCMFASHDSLRDDFQVSCPELDLLVDFGRELTGEGGVFGTKMTGGGFGGCTVSLVRTEKIAEIAEAIGSQYRAATGISPTCFPARPARGAHVVWEAA